MLVNKITAKMAPKNISAEAVTDADKFFWFPPLFLWLNTYCRGVDVAITLQQSMGCSRLFFCEVICDPGKSDVLLSLTPVALTSPTHAFPPDATMKEWAAD